MLCSFFPFIFLPPSLCETLYSFLLSLFLSLGMIFGHWNFFFTYSMAFSWVNSWSWAPVVTVLFGSGASAHPLHAVFIAHSLRWCHKEKKVQLKVWRPELPLRYRGVCYLGLYFSSLPLTTSWIWHEFYLARSKQITACRFWAHFFSLFLWNSSNSFHSGLPILWAWSFPVSFFLFPTCCFAPCLFKFLRSLHSNSKVNLLTCQADSGWVNSFLFPCFFTYLMDTSKHTYTCIYVPTHTHPSTMTLTHTYLMLYYHALGS